MDYNNNQGNGNYDNNMNGSSYGDYSNQNTTSYGDYSNQNTTSYGDYNNQNNSSYNYGTTDYSSQTNYNNQVPGTDPSARGFEIGGLICGIASIVICCFSIWLGIIVGIVGIVLSIVAKNKNNGVSTGMMTAGLVCSIVGAGLSLLTFILAVVFSFSLGF